MQLLCQFDTAGSPEWKAAFDRDAEDRRLAGLTLLQIWHGADEPAQVFCLFEVNDRPRAQAWIDREAGFGNAMTAHFLATAS